MINSIVFDSFPAPHRARRSGVGGTGSELGRGPNPAVFRVGVARGANGGAATTTPEETP